MPSEKPSKKKNFSQNVILPVSLGILSLVAGLWLSQQILINNNDAQVPKNLDATVLPNARLLVEFNLLDQNQKTFSPAQLKGQWSFLFFGFTNCPDVCPTTLKVMQSMWKTLPTKIGDKGHPKLYFVSVDPQRDKPEILKNYVQYFNPEFNGITGKLNEIDKLTNQIGILYGFDEKDGDNDKEYIVNHSSQLILVDPKGRMRAVISPPHDAKTIASNFQTIRTFYGD
ncbi:MAG: SCO family protein [Gammaproteobacteria bacterium]|nr:SCO family protein [Gammaproteobacteria bacterium]MDH5661118.1 SCO family protein [Gammaproteobacteria bacterium]